MVNDIAVLSDNTIYLAHTSNSLIYQLKRETNTYANKIVVGQENFFGNRDDDNGKQALIQNPRNIIKNREETELFFIDNNTFIKNIKIQSDSIIGNTIGEPLTATPPNSNIYTNYGFNYASSEDPKSHIYFSSLTNLYKVFIDSTQETEMSSTSLTSPSKFVDISFYNNVLYYCYTTNNTSFIFKKSNDFINYNITNDQSLTVSLDSRIQNNVKGFSITSNLLLVLGFNAIQSFTTTDYISFTSNNLRIITQQFTALIDYKAIYNDNCNFVIGRRSDFKNFYKIDTTTLKIDTSGEFVVNMRNDYSINVLSEGDTQDYTINENIIYNNRYLKTSEAENIILHYNESSSNIQKIKCINSEFKTKRLNFTSNNELIEFTNIVDIAINNLNTLYIATTSNIYNIDVTSGNSDNSFALNNTTIITDGSIIRSIYYSDANPNVSDDFLHYVTSSYYNVLNLKTNTKSISSNIRQTDNTDSLSKLNDFVIDNNYEIGYMAFTDRLKWFYL